MPLEGGPPLTPAFMRQGRQQGRLVVIAPSAAWEGDSIFYTAAARQGVQIWRQRVSQRTFDAIGTRGHDTGRLRVLPVGDPRASGVSSALTPTSTSGRSRSTPPPASHGPLRRLTRGAGIVSHLTVSQDGRRSRISGSA